jgi:hypothetical protein
MPERKPRRWPDLRQSPEHPRKTSLLHAHAYVKQIGNDYLHAKAQICMPASVLSNTLHRLEYFHFYGPLVFDETLLDPIKTIKTDAIHECMNISNTSKRRYSFRSQMSMIFILHLFGFDSFFFNLFANGHPVNHRILASITGKKMAKSN